MKKKINNEEIIKNIENPIIKRALEKRAEEFLFNYGDGDGHSDSGNHTDEILPGSPRRYNDAWRKQIRYEDHVDKYGDIYADCTKDCMGYI